MARGINISLTPSQVNPWKVFCKRCHYRRELVRDNLCAKCILQEQNPWKLLRPQSSIPKVPST